MQFSLIAVLAAAAGIAAAQDEPAKTVPVGELPVTSLVIPSSAPPSGCQNSREGTFHLSVRNVTNSAPEAAAAVKRQNDFSLTLVGGVMKDQQNRLAYIASNYQFQFDGPPQAGAIYTAGWTICPNGSLALGGQAIFYQCRSGPFFNLYDRDWAAHCNGVYFLAAEGQGSAFSQAPPASEHAGPDQATIPNGGGTNILTNTGEATATGTGGATVTGTGGPTGTGGATSAQGTAAASETSGGGAPMMTAGLGGVLGLAGLLAVL